MKQILSDSADTTQIRLLFCNTTADDVLVRDEMDTLAAEHPDRCVHVILSSPLLLLYFISLKSLLLAHLCTQSRPPPRLNTARARHRQLCAAQSARKARHQRDDTRIFRLQFECTCAGSKLLIQSASRHKAGSTTLAALIWPCARRRCSRTCQAPSRCYAGRQACSSVRHTLRLNRWALRRA